MACLQELNIDLDRHLDEDGTHLELQDTFALLTYVYLQLDRSLGF